MVMWVIYQYLAISLLPHISVHHQGYQMYLKLDGSLVVITIIIIHSRQERSLVIAISNREKLFWIKQLVVVLKLVALS